MSFSSTGAHCIQCVWDDPFANWVSQLAHAMGGALAVVVLVALFGRRSIPFSVVLFGLYAAVKEGWWDETYESKCDRGTGWLDFLWYMVGVLGGCIIELVGWLLKSWRKPCYAWCDRKCGRENYDVL